MPPAQRTACPYRHTKPSQPRMRELPGDIGVWSVIERRHNPHQPGCRGPVGTALEFRLGCIEKPGERGLAKLDRNASVLNALCQAPPDIVENLGRGLVGEV